MSAATMATVGENPWLSQTARIERIVSETPGVATYHLRLTKVAGTRVAGTLRVPSPASATADSAFSPLSGASNGDGCNGASYGTRSVPTTLDYQFRPGQFNMLYLPGAGEIAISLSGAADGALEHTIRVAGNVTRTLARLPVGATLGLRGPYGSWWPIEENAGADFILVAGGIGLAPLRPVIRGLMAGKKKYGRVSLLVGARSPDGLLYGHEYAAWSTAKVNVELTVDRSSPGWMGNIGVVPLLVDRLRPLSPVNTVLLVCGPEVMMRYTVRSALSRGLRKDQIWVSLERNMQCAVGLCGHCQLGPAFVCKDGPVFRYDQIEPFLDVEML